MPLTVAFDGRTLASPAAGVRRYSTELFGALSERPDVRVISVGGPATVPPRVRPVAEAWSLPTNLGWALSGLPRSAARVHPDVFHAPAYTAPLVGCRPLVVSIHDVSYARRPEPIPTAAIRCGGRSTPEVLAARIACHLLVVSRMRSWRPTRRSGAH